MTDIPFGPDEQLVGDFDEEAAMFRVTSWTAGPAGTARIEPVEGLTVDVDYAQPAVLAELLFDAPGYGLRGLGQRAMRFLEAYLGRMAVVRLAEMGTPKSPPRRVLNERDDFDRGRPVHPVREQVGRLALALEAAAAEADETSQAAYFVEAAGIAARLANVLSAERLSSIVGDAASVAGELVDASRRGDLDAGAEVGLARLLSSAADVASAETGDELRRAGEELRGSSDRAARTSAMRAAAPMAASAYAPLRVVESLELPALVPFEGHVTPAATFTHDNEVTVELGYVSIPASAWVRAFDRRNGTLLALGPVQNGDDGEVISRLFVPAGLGASDLLIDVTTEPASPANSADRLALIRALDAGRRACAYERAGDRRSAEREWQRCALAWREVGDPTRSQLAEQYAYEGVGGGRRPRSQPGGRAARPFIADRL